MSFVLLCVSMDAADFNVLALDNEQPLNTQIAVVLIFYGNAMRIFVLTLKWHDDEQN